MVFNATFNNIAVISWGVTCIGGGHLSTSRKQLTCRESLTNLNTSYKMSHSCSFLSRYFSQRYNHRHKILSWLEYTSISISWGPSCSWSHSSLIYKYMCLNSSDYWKCISFIWKYVAFGPSPLIGMQIYYTNNHCLKLHEILGFGFMVFNATFNNIAVISYTSISISWGPSCSWSHSSLIYKYMCNQCLSKL
jgi:hypothetical protein